MNRNTQHSRTVDFILFGVIALIWSSSFLFIKIAVQSVPPVTIAAVRLLIGTLLLWSYMRLNGERLPGSLGGWMSCVFIGVFGNVLPFILIGSGEIAVDSGTAAILMGIMPVTTVLLAHLLVPEERFTPRIGLGILLGFSGLLVLVGVDALKGIGATTFAQLAILGAAICYAVNTVFVRRDTGLSGPTMAAGSQVAGCIMVWPLALWFDRPWTLNPTSEGIGAVLILSVFATSVATVFYFRIVKNLGASIMAQVNYIVPVLGTGWGILFLEERPHISALVALVLVLSAVAIISRKPSTR